MIKEKHDKGPDSVKEEPGSSDKDCGSTEPCIKKEEDAAGGGCDVKKQPLGRTITKKNGGFIGSTNTGSLHSGNELKCEVDDSAVVGDVPSLPTKVEDGLEELSSDAFGLGLPPAPPHPPPHDGVQPLQSNVISKQPNNMEVQYMQQQSQIFVFSTELANAGAEQVLHGHYSSIIAYHCAQPGTKKYLEKNPLKINQFTRQSSLWLNNLSTVKNKGCTRSPGLIPTKGSLDLFLESDGLDEMVGLSDSDLSWDQKSNHHLEALDSVSNGLPDVPDLDASSPSLANMQPSLQGVKVPDENLTPQQRQHREEQLATIRKMHQILFPETQHIDGEFPEIPHGMIPDSLLSSGGPTHKTAQIEWQKLQQQFYEERTKVKHGSLGLTCSNRPLPASGPRLQGPPPPYHQTQRSASVPVAMQSPNPGSPNNPTSNLSLPSPRASSALNSPADSNRAFNLNRHMSTGQSPTSQGSPTSSRPNPMSNPGTPVSSHLSPSVNNNESSNSHQSTVDGMFGRTLQSMAQQKQMSSTGQPKEPNLMPVPSPQQIQYLNTFEGQELIIQKQPNTSLKEGNVISSPVLSTSMDSGFPGSSDLPPSRVSGSNTPTSVDMGRYPTTPGVPSEGCRFQIPSPHTPTGPSDKSQRLSGPPSSGLSPQTVAGPSSDSLKGDLYPTRSPHMMDVHRFSGSSTSPGPKLGGGFVVSPSGKPPMDMPPYGCPRADNVPLNPNCTNTMTGNPKISHFDPISSLAQMSQQLTNSVASSLNGQGAQGGNMMNFGSPSMHMMDMGPCHGLDLDQGPGGMLMPMQVPPPGFHPNSPMGPIRSLSPKLPGAFPNHMPMPRMMGRPPGPNPYNGANVQVKPNAPNTIQYMPAKSQIGNPSPRGPPSLDFLQRFANPHPNLDSKMPSQNLQYFPNCGPGGPMQGPGGPIHSHMGHLDGPLGPQDGPMGHMMAGPMGNGPGPMMGNMGMPGPEGMMSMMRGPMRPGMMRVPHMGFNGPPSGGPDVMYNSNMNHPNTQMFVTGPKVSPMGLGAPDATQPLPPSMGQSNSFKNAQFVGPTTADPNYAQQFHNFQQQLYATCTRNQIGGPAMGSAPGPPHSQQPPYFNPK